MANGNGSGHAKRGRKRTNIWTVPGLEKRCRELIDTGLLVRNKDQEICDTINTEFAEPLKEMGRTLSLTAFTAHLDELLWTPARNEELMKFLRDNLVDPETVYAEYFPTFPKKRFMRKVKFYRGIFGTSEKGGFKRGMGRLFTEELPKGAENRVLPACSFDEPYVIPAGPDWTASIINGANLGIKYNPIIKENPVRRALSDAEKRKDAVVILTNLLYVDTTKVAGGNKTYRDQASGLNTNLEDLPAFYRKEAERILQTRPKDEGVWVSIAARVLSVSKGWQKISHRPDGSPEFNGKVVAFIGFNEEKLINDAAYAEYRYITLRKQRNVKRSLAVAENRLRSAMLRHSKKYDNSAEIAKWSQRVNELEQMDAFVILSNFESQLVEWHRRRMRAQVIHKLEKAIPNCTVVCQGSGYLSIGGEKVQISIPNNIEVTDGLLASFNDNAGEKMIAGTMARTAVICHPFALNHRMVGRDDYTDGERSDAEVHVAGICVDDDYLRKHLKDTIKPIHPIVKVLQSRQFEPSVLVLNKNNGRVFGDPFPITKLDNGPKPTEKTGGAAGYFPYPDTKYIWIIEPTDLHFGGRSREHLWYKAQKRHLGPAEAVVEMFRREGLLADTGRGGFPLHHLTINDDPIQANHFDTHKQPDPAEMSVQQIEEWWLRRQEEVAALARKGDAAAVIDAISELARFNLGQFLVRGLDWVQPQMEAVFDCLIKPNLDFFSAVLNNVQRAKIVIRGLSEIRHKPHDGRDLGSINIGASNHTAATLEDNLTEGVFYARYLKALLGGLPRWQKDHPFIEKHVRAPLYSNEYFAVGTLQVPGGYEWAITHLGAPARLSSWSDPLSAVVTNDMARGDTFGHMIGRVTLKTHGDKHFKNRVNTKRIKYVMGPANTHTDLYGERGFPPNNTGILFIGLPADGPDAGPVLVRSLMYSYLRDWFANPKPFDWAKFLPRPV